MMTEAQIRLKYGKPGDEDNFKSIQLPYPMRIAWDTKTTVTKMRCHKLVAANFINVFNDLLEHYGLPELQRLGIDLFGGCYNLRKKRGGNSWSTHSWSIAIDLHPSMNQLKWKKDKALFAKPEYKAMMDIFYKHGFENQGVELGYDFMHFQIAS